MKARVSASLQTFLQIFNLFPLILSHVGNYDDCLHSNIFTTKFCEYTYSTVISFPFEKI